MEVTYLGRHRASRLEQVLARLVGRTTVLKHRVDLVHEFKLELPPDPRVDGRGQASS